MLTDGSTKYLGLVETRGTVRVLLDNRSVMPWPYRLTERSLFDATQKMLNDHYNHPDVPYILNELCAHYKLLHIVQARKIELGIELDCELCVDFEENTPSETVIALPYMN